MIEPFLDATIEARPDAVVLSFADPRPWATRLRDAGISLICQVQDNEGAAQAVDAGATWSWFRAPTSGPAGRPS